MAESLANRPHIVRRLSRRRSIEEVAPARPGSIAIRGSVQLAWGSNPGRAVNVDRAAAVAAGIESKEPAQAHGASEVSEVAVTLCCFERDSPRLTHTMAEVQIGTAVATA